MAAPTAPPTPEQWPPEVVEQYEPLRTLGKGGFASVMLARKKDDSNGLVAMKVVGTSGDFSKQEHGYAHREIDILTEISHPHIMKLLQYWRVAKDSSLIVMALSYNKGPTLEQLIQFGGAFGLVFGRVVMTQLVDAIGYCHSRAVIHRDIKPDNVIVTGASPSSEELWMDHLNPPQEQNDDNNGNTKEEDWKELCTKWHVTLIDFGFARALTPDDIEKEKVAVKRLSTLQQSPASMHSGKFSTTLDASNGEENNNNNTGRRNNNNNRRMNSRRNLDKSVSHAMTRTMSALGNRLYAAPEIVQGVHSRHSISGATTNANNNGGGSTHSSFFRTSTHHPVDITQTLSAHVANYGLLADAYSLGNTLQYMMTGVPPNQNVTEVISNHNNPVAVLFRWIGKHVCGGGGGDSNQQGGRREYRYRPWKDMPKEAMQLIRGLNNPSVSQRISVRATRRYPYIETVLLAKEGQGQGQGQEDDEMAHHRIHFLKCALKQQQEEEEQQQQQQTATATNTNTNDETTNNPAEEQQETAPLPLGGTSNSGEATVATTTTKGSEPMAAKKEEEDSPNPIDQDPVPQQEAATEDVTTTEEDVGLPI